MKLLKTILSVLVPIVIATNEITIADSDLPELEYLNPDVNPCEDFYEFSCGNFKNVHPKPEQEEVSDIFTLVEDHVLYIGKNILSMSRQESDPVALKKAKSAYSACLDTEYADTIKVPETQIIEEVGGWPLIPNSKSTPFKWSDIGNIVGKYGLPLFFDFSLNQINRDSHIILIMPDTGTENPGIRINNRKSYDHFLERSFIDAAQNYNPTKFTSNQDPFFKFIHTVAGNIIKSSHAYKPEEELIRDLCNVMQFAKQLYSSNLFRENYSLSVPTTIQNLQNWTEEQFGSDADMNWLDYIQAIFKRAGVDISKNTVIYHLGEKSIHSILKLLTETDDDVVKNFVLLRIFLFLAPDSDKITRGAFEEYCIEKNIPLYSRSDYCARKILDVIDVIGLSVAVTYEYQRNYFNVNKFPQVSQLINTVQSVYANSFLTTNWICPEIQQAIKAKFDDMIVLLGYPEFASNVDQLDRFYENMRICKWDNYGNAQRLRAFQKAYQLSRYAAPRRNYWDHSPFTVGAYYNRINNKVIVPLALLNSTFYQIDTPLVQFSRLGFIVGHELTHAFDQNSKIFDTIPMFAEKNQCLVDQYNKYFIPEIGLYVNGTKSASENLCDNGGLRQSYKAFSKYISSHKIKNSSKTFSPDQLFFIGFATTFCSQESSDYLRKVVTGAYSPAKYRVIGALSNLQEFSNAFKCPAGSKMNPVHKCELW